MKTKRFLLKGVLLPLLGLSLPLGVSGQTRDRIEPKLVPVPDHGDECMCDQNVIDVWNQGGAGTSVRPGQNMKVSFRSKVDAYVVLIDIDTRGRASLLFPDNRYDDGFVRAGRTVTLPGRNAGYKLQVRGPAGVERIVAYASNEPLVDHWEELIDNDLAYLGWSEPRRSSFSAAMSVNTGGFSGAVAANTTAPRIQRSDLEPQLVRVPVDHECLDRDETWFRVLRGYGRGW